MTNKKWFNEGTEVVKGNEIKWYQIESDYYGNPRFVVHFLDLDIKSEDYGKIKGLTKYRGKWFGGGYVFQSYNIKDDLVYAVNTVENFYK